MSRREFALLALLTVVSGLVGGALSNRIFSSAPAFAQDEPTHAKCIQAESFQLLDARGNIRAELCVCPEGNPGLALIDENYIPRAKFALAEGGKPSLRFLDENPRLQAHTPPGEEILVARPGIGYSKLGEESSK